MQGTLYVSFKDLVEVFGPPHDDGDGYKIDVRWILRFEGHPTPTVATIYNYKSGPNYNGDRSINFSKLHSDPDKLLKAPEKTPSQQRAIEKVQEWSIGGRSKQAVREVHDALNSKGIKFR